MVEVGVCTSVWCFSPVHKSVYCSSPPHQVIAVVPVQHFSVLQAFGQNSRDFPRLKGSKSVPMQNALLKKEKIKKGRGHNLKASTKPFSVLSPANANPLLSMGLFPLATINSGFTSAAALESRGGGRGVPHHCVQLQLMSLEKCKGNLISVPRSLLSLMHIFLLHIKAVLAMTGR